MLGNWIINGFLPAFLVLLIEYFVIQPFRQLEANKRNRLFAAILVSITLVFPLSLWQAVAFWFASFFSSLAEAERVDVYVNAYGLLALIWGCSWMALIRPWLYRLGGLSNG